MSTSDLSRLTLNRDAAPLPPRRRPGPWLLAAVILLALGGGLLLGRNRPVEVETTRVSLAWPSQALSLLNATGYVSPARKAAVASKASGRLEWLGVTEGSRVRAGEVIARLENRDAAAQVRQARAQVQVAEGQRKQAEAELREAERALARMRELHARGFVAESVLDAALARHDRARAALAAAEAGLAAAQAALAGARVALDATLIRAPFEGVVLTKHANVGDVITPFNSALETKGAVVTLADMSTLEVEADVSESSLHQVRVGQPCEIQLEAVPGVRFGGHVARIVPTVDRTKATVLVKVAFDRLDPRVLPEMAAKVSFLARPLAPGETTPRLALPADALLRQGAETVAFRVEGDRVRRVRVLTGEPVGDLVTLREGLREGDTVVLRPAADLADGRRVRVAGR